MRDKMGRLQYLDGLRGVAISTVVLVHAYASWPRLVPYGDQLANFPLIQNGWLAVELFFLISGFVIFMSLDKSSDAKSFLLNRWVRLFPAMLICSALILLLSQFLPDRPQGPPTLAALAPGLLFLDPFWLSHFGISAQSLEGTFWSLYVEVAFYVIVGVIYFVLGRRGALLCIFSLFCIAVALNILRSELPDFANSFLVRKLLVISDHTGMIYFGWFLSGMLAYEAFVHRKRWSLLRGLAVGILAALTVFLSTASVQGRTIHAEFPAIFVVLLFYATVASATMQRLISNRVFVFIGFVSYPLYLLHESPMIAGIVKLGRIFPSFPPLLLPILPIALLVALSWIVATYLEPALRSRLAPIARRATQWLPTRSPILRRSPWTRAGS